MSDGKPRGDAVSRRSFLQTAGKLTVGGLAAPAFTGSPAVRPANAQTAHKRPQRVALVGVNHYHAWTFPNYLRIVESQHMEVVGIHDPDPSVAEKHAKEHNSTPYTDYRTMIDRTKPDFVVALGRHVDMPPVFRFLVETGIPFLMEKPWGVDAATVNQLADLAEAKKAWAAVPMSMRYSWWAETARTMRRRGELGRISHILVRFNQPGPQRYIDWGCAWMLSKAAAGGGALINLGIHGFDLCRYITGEEPTVVSAVTSHEIHKREVEDYAFVTLRTPSGIVFLNEASYTFPTTGSDQEHKVAAEKAFLRETADGVQIVTPDRNEVLKPPAGYQSGWPGVVIDCLDRIGRGDPPPATARDCARAVSLTFDAYRIAGEV
jgi:predicted dehydrogenase